MKVNRVNSILFLLQQLRLLRLQFRPDFLARLLAQVLPALLSVLHLLRFIDRLACYGLLWLFALLVFVALALLKQILENLLRLHL